MAVEQKTCRICKQLLTPSIVAANGSVCKPCDAADKRARRAAYKAVHASGQPVPLEKHCATCKQQLSADHFARCSTTADGLDTACKECKRDGIRKRQLQDQGRISKDHTLYVFLNPVLPNMVKIGRTSNVNQRARTLSSSHPFEIQVCYEYPGYGFLEQIIHDRLRDFRVTGFITREWFTVSVEHAHAIISGAIAEWELAHPQ